MTIETFDLTPMPLYNQDLDVGEGPQPVSRFREAIDRADGVLIATPEYQHGISGVLKNALDWASRPPGRSVLRGKPIAMMGASPRPVGTGLGRAKT
jgi:chromate reductase, NAD(P)H dehydrogenase (quinone)